MKISKMKMLTGWIAVMFMIAFTSVGFAGTLEPPESAIDSGTGEPKPTMKTLDSIPGTWDRLLDSTNGDPTTGCNSDRFTCVMNNEAVRDNETGLVWEKSPLTTFHTWLDAAFVCRNLTVGSRIGWRLPSVHELASLVDSGSPDANHLPTGNPFRTVGATFIWSSTTFGLDSERTWSMDFFNGTVSSGVRTSSAFVLCVRGGLNHGHIY